MSFFVSQSSFKWAVAPALKHQWCYILVTLDKWHQRAASSINLSKAVKLRITLPNQCAKALVGVQSHSVSVAHCWTYLQSPLRDTVWFWSQVKNNRIPKNWSFLLIHNPTTLYRSILKMLFMSTLMQKKQSTQYNILSSQLIFLMYLCNVPFLWYQVRDNPVM